MLFYNFDKESHDDRFYQNSQSLINGKHAAEGVSNQCASCIGSLTNASCSYLLADTVAPHFTISKSQQSQQTSMILTSSSSSWGQRTPLRPSTPSWGPLSSCLSAPQAAAACHKALDPLGRQCIYRLHGGRVRVMTGELNTGEVMR